MDKKWVKKRTLIGFSSLIIFNSYFKGFLLGKIYTGKFKKICIPGMNCYSCPGSMGACPIGSLQAVINSIKYNFSFYVIGLISLYGIAFGRLICGFLCPFGFVQDMLYKIPFVKKIQKKDKYLKYLKYCILIIFVILLPLVTIDEIGLSDPYFCKYICPVGTLEGGIPLVLMNSTLRKTIGFLYAWKITILIITILLSIIIYRPFCRYVCPLGAIYSLFNPISFFRIKVDKNKCIKCGMCTNTCKMKIKVYEQPNSLECIRCGECISKCPTNALEMGFGLKQNNKI